MLKNSLPSIQLLQDAIPLLQNVSDYARKWSEAGAQPVYDTAFASAIGGYPAGSVLQSADGSGFWISTADNNQSDPDGAAPSNWEPHVFHGVATIAVGAVDVVLKPKDYAKPNLVISGALSADVAVVLPSLVRQWVIQNETVGAHQVTVKTASGQGVVLRPGSQMVWGDGSNILLVTPFPAVSGAEGHYAQWSSDGGLKDSQQSASNGSNAYVVTSPGALPVGHIAKIADANGSIGDGGVLGSVAGMNASNASNAYAVTSPGSLPVGHIAKIADTNGSIGDGGVLGSAAGLNASNASNAYAVTSPGSLPVGHIAKIADANGSIGDGGVLGSAAGLNASSVVAGAGLSSVYSFPGNPNGHVAGQAAVVGVSPPDLCWDAAEQILWTCTLSGTAANAVWQKVGGADPVVPLSADHMVSTQDHSVNFVATAAVSVTLPQANSITNGACAFSLSAQGGAVTIIPAGSDRIVVGQTILAAGASYMLAQGASAFVVCDGAGKWYLLSLAGPGAQSSALRNLLINTDVLNWVNQRGYVSGGQTSTALQYTVDRWRVVTSGQALTWVGAVATAPAGAVEQVVEGTLIPRSGTYTLSWVGTATATVNGTPVNNGGQTILTSGSNASVRFSSGTFSSPQLEYGTSATAYEAVPFDVQLARCLRYFQKTFDYSIAPRANTNNYSGCIAALASGVSALSNVIVTWRFPVLMRAVPTMQCYTPGNNTNYPDCMNDSAGVYSSVSLVAASRGAVTVYNSGTPMSTDQPVYLHATASAEL